MPRLLDPLVFQDATAQATAGLLPAQNLSDVASLATARTTLGINPQALVLTFTRQGGGTLQVGDQLIVPWEFAATLVGWTLLGDVSGSLVLRIYKVAGASYTGWASVSTLLTASAPPTLASQARSQNSTLTGWTTTINQNDVLLFNIQSVSTIAKATLALRYHR